MNIFTRVTLSAALLCAACATNTQDAPAPAAPDKATLAERAGAPLFDGMGTYHRPVSNISPEAQIYFDQGMVTAFGFNHAEAVRAFRAAQRLDPDCAMCYWGEAYALGPNINVVANGKAVMGDEDRIAARAAADKALALKDNASPAEAALIDALDKRYNGDPATERFPLDLAYAEAMGEVAASFPQDDDFSVLYADALMVTMPWDYWSEGGEPKPETVAVIDALETIIARTPDHPLALHLYIHAVEASGDPGRAEDEADRLANLVPGSGHLVHMPAHIYFRIGRYDDAATANVRAAAVDEAYIAACNAQGFYPALYYPHNIHFLWAAASMAGQRDLSLESGRKVADNVRLEQIEQFPTVEFFKTIPIQSLARFAMWDEILAEPQPPEQLDYSNAIWHYARGLALANTGDLNGARAERAALVPYRDTVQIEFLDTAGYPASTLLKIADDLLLGEIAYRGGDLENAIAYYSDAVEKQDTLPYTEPPFWYYPTRQSLGQALLDAGRYGDAEAVYRRDLEEYPRNGWSYSGLADALTAQGKTEEAARARAKFETIWAKADIELTGSRL